MAKLEDLVTPTELLDAIKSGSLKSELAKKYRASEADLAMMLQPLYRQGRLTKEEFNSFFKGLALHSQSRTEPASGPANTETSASNHDAPTEMLPTSTLEKAPEETNASSVATDVSIDVEDPGLQLVPAKISQPKTEAASIDDERHTSLSLSGEFKVGVADSASVTALLDMIFSRLVSIDDRLALIEKKIGSA